MSVGDPKPQSESRSLYKFMYNEKPNHSQINPVNDYLYEDEFLPEFSIELFPVTEGVEVTASDPRGIKYSMFAIISNFISALIYVVLSLPFAMPTQVPKIVFLWAVTSQGGQCHEYKNN